MRTRNGTETLVIRDLLLVFKEDRTATIYKTAEVSRVEKVKAEVTVKAGETFTSQTGIELVSIPAREFLMGCSEGDNQCQPNEMPAP
jgi:formylglycine-generating enzyme required for sulfatase activity